jgi:hypothetical protein
MSNNGKIYYFKVSELVVLLAAGGVASLYGLKMDIGSLDRKAIYETMFALQRKEILWGDGEEMSMAEDVSELIDNIKNSKLILMYVSRTTDYPQRFVYIGNKAVIVAPHGTSGDVLELEITEVSGLVDKICTEWFVLEQVISDDTLYSREAVCGAAQIEENAKRLLHKDINVISTQQWEYALHCIRFINVNNHQCVRQYLLLEKGLNDYIAVSSPKGTDIYAYSVRKMSDILNEDLGGLE